MNKMALLSDKMSEHVTDKNGLITLLDALAERKTIKTKVNTIWSIEGYKNVAGKCSITLGRVDISNHTNPKFVSEEIEVDESVKDIITESMDSNLVMKDTQGEYYFLSESVYFTLTGKVGITTASLSERDMNGRAVFLNDLMAGQEYTIGYAEEGGMKRAFVIGSPEYCHINAEELKNLCTILDGWKMGPATVIYGRADQDMTEVVLGFEDVPRLASGEDINEVYKIHGFMPAVVLQTSDNGHSSYRAIAAWVRNGRYVTEAVHSRKHRYAVNLQKLAKDIEKNVFDKFTRLLPTLNKLSENMVSDGTNGIFEVDNYLDNLMTKAQEKLIRKSDSWATAKLLKAVKEGARTKIAAEYDLSDPIMASDIVTTVMAAVEYVQAPKSHEVEFSAFLGQIPYLAESL